MLTDFSHEKQIEPSLNKAIVFVQLIKYIHVFEHPVNLQFPKQN